MSPADLNFATSCIRGLHTMLGALKTWVGQKDLSPADETFVRAIDNAGDAAKTWLRSKVIKAGEDASE